MRRREIVSSLKTIDNALGESDLTNILEKAMEELPHSPPAKYIPDIIKAYGDFHNKAQTFDEHTKSLIDIFGLSDIDSPDYWAELMKMPGKKLAGIIEKLEYVIGVNANLIKMFDDSSDKTGIEFKGATGKLSVIVIEDKGKNTKPRRLIDAMESTVMIYEAAAVINKELCEGLNIKSLDSGDDKIIDFIGSQKVIDAAKEIILSIWDRIVYFKHYKANDRINMVLKALPVIDHIKDMENAKTIERESAEILRRKITEGVRKFIDSGAIIPEMEKKWGVHDPRIIMAVEQKLISQSCKGDEAANNESVDTKVAIDVDIKREFTEDTSDVIPESPENAYNRSLLFRKFNKVEQSGIFKEEMKNRNPLLFRKFNM